MQVNSFDVEIVDGVVSTRPRITNAAEAISQGLEADARWSAADWLTLGASVGLLDAEYGQILPRVTATVPSHHPQEYVT